MADMDGWDWALLVAGGYLAITSLVQLMRHRRNIVVDQLSSQVAMEKRRQKNQNQKNQHKKKLPPRKQQDATRGRAA